MADKKTDSNAEANVEADVFPADWEGLEQYDPVMAGLPGMVQAEAFTPAQSAEYLVIDGMLTERLDAMREAGLFGGRMPSRKADAAKASRDAVRAIAEYVSVADQFYAGLAVDKDAYRKWAEGRTVNDLFAMFTLLQRYYGERLGKSSASKRRSETVE